MQDGSGLKSGVAVVRLLPIDDRLAAIGSSRSSRNPDPRDPSLYLLDSLLSASTISVSCVALITPVNLERDSVGI